MADPITQDPAAQKAPRPPIDIDAIMGTPTPKPAGGEPQPDHSWMDAPVSAPESETMEQPTWMDDAMHALSEGGKALYRGPANAAAAGANLVNSAFRMLPGIDENTPGFGRVPVHPLGTSDNIGAGLVENITQFATGFAAGGPVVKAIGTGVKGAEILLGAEKGLSLVGNAAAGALTDFTAFDARAGRLTDLIGKIPGLEGLDLNSQDDGEIEGRIKNAAEGVGLGAAVHGIIAGVRALRAGRKAIAGTKWPGLPEATMSEADRQALEKAWADAERTFTPEIKAQLNKSADDIERAFKGLDDFRLANASPFRGQLVDDAVRKSNAEQVWINVDGSEAHGFTIMQPKPKPALRDIPNEQAAAMLEQNLQHESAVATDVLGRELKADKGVVDAYVENVRKMREGGPEAAAAQAQVDGVLEKLSARGRKKLRAAAPSGQTTEDIQAAIKYKTGGWEDRQQPRFVSLTSAKVGDPKIDKELLTSWVNKHGTLLDNPQTTIKLNPDGTAEIGVSLSGDQWTPEAKKIADSLAASKDMTPAQLGEAAQGLTKPRQPSPPNPEPPPPAKPPEAPGGTGEAAAGMPAPAAPKPLTPHQIYLGEIGYDAKTADEIADLLHGEFVEGMTERGEVALAFKERADATHGPSQPYTDAVNPKHMTREELLSRKLREKGMNFEGLKGQPEVLAQAARTLEKMNVALRQAENPLLVKETFAEMTARAQVEQDIVLGIVSNHDKASYIKLAEKAGVENANKIGAQAKAFTDIAVGIALDLYDKSLDFVARRKANTPIAPWELAAWAETRGLGVDSMGAAENLKNALARNLYMQRGEIKPVTNVARMTTAQLQSDAAALERILMDNGGLGKIEKDAAKIAASGGRDLYKIAETLRLARDSQGLLGMTIETGYAAMLSGFKTPIFQLVGNLSVAAYQPFRRIFSAAAALPFERNPQNVAALKGEIAKGIGTYTALFQSIPEMLRGYKSGFMDGPTLNPRGSAMNVRSRASRQQITARNAAGVLAKARIPLDPDGAIGDFINGVGSVVSGPGRALGGGDEAVMVGVYRALAQADLTHHWLQSGLSGTELGTAVAQDMDRLIYKGQALSVDQLERRALEQVHQQGYTGIHAAERKNRLVAEWQQSDWYKRLSGLSEYAIKEGQEAAMNRPLEPGTVGGGLQKVFNRHPLLMFTAAPFHRTSVNIGRFVLQHFDAPALAQWLGESMFRKPGSAAGETANRFLSDMRSGDPIRQANARGRLMLGTVAASGIAGMYMAGMVTGRGPADPEQRSRLRKTGWLPYSIQNPVDGKFYEYKRFEPMASVIGLVADISQSVDELPDDRLPDAWDMAKGVGVALAANTTNKSYAQGLLDFLEAVTSPDENLDSWLKSLATRFVPNIARDASNAVDAIQGVDPAYKEIRTLHDAMVAKVPWMGTEALGSSRDLEPRRDILGEPILRPSEYGIVRVGRKGDAVDAELAALEHIGGAPGSKRGGYDMFDIKASNGQSSYDRWLENSGTIKLGGKNLRQMLGVTISSGVYQRMNADEVNGQPSQRASALNSIIDRYRRAAMLQTQREIPELNQAEMQSRLMRAGVTIGAR